MERRAARRACRIGIASAALLASCTGGEPPLPRMDAGRFGSVAVARPATAPDAFVFVVAEGEPGVEAAARDLAGGGAVVVVVDLAAYRQGLAASDDGCHYVVAELEALSQRLQREMGGSAYRSPLVAGIGEGATLAYAALAQAPAATLRGAVAIDPAPVLHTRVPLCAGAASQPAAGGGFAYTAKADLPGDFLLSARTTPAAALAALAASIEDAPPLAAPPVERLVALVRTAALGGDVPPALRDLPLTELPVEKPARLMAVIYSGDGGWRDLDKEIGEALARRGVPVVGVDSLRYFWSRKEPATVARDLAEILDAYGDRWGTKQVVLIGYSFGAAILPFAIDALPPALRERIAGVSLLGLGPRAEFQIQVEGWLGAEPAADAPAVLPALTKLDLARVQCFYGAEEDDTLCRDPGLEGAERIETKGGHHFDGDYAALAQRIYDAAITRVGAAP